MDIFAHLLWTVAIYWQHPKRWIAGIIGLLPDVIAFGPHILFTLLTGGSFGPRHEIPSWVFTLYSISHSLVIFAVVAIIMWFAKREWFWLLGGWLLHIIIDLPTHTAEFFPTPLFWPISSFHVSGMSWGTTWFMIANYSALAAIYTWLIWKVPRRSSPQSF